MVGDIEERLRLENKLYWHAHHFHCEIIDEWVVRDNLKCIRCDKSGENPRCFCRKGIKHER